jgi:hypothetical protein
MEKLANKQVIEASSLFLDLSEDLINKIDLYLSNSDLSKRQQSDLLKIMEQIYSEGYITSIIE